MDEPIWVEMPEVLVAHSRQLAKHAGSDGSLSEEELAAWFTAHAVAI